MQDLKISYIWTMVVRGRFLSFSDVNLSGQGALCVGSSSMIFCIKAGETKIFVSWSCVWYAVSMNASMVFSSGDDVSCAWLWMFSNTCANASASSASE